MLTVVIPVLGPAPALPAALRRLAPAREVLVCLDAHAPPPDVLMLDAPGSVAVVRADDPGHAAARNAGIRMASQPVTLLLDPALVPERDVLERHAQFHAARPEDDQALLGRVLVPDPRSRLRRRLLPTDVLTGDHADAEAFSSAHVSLKTALLQRVDGFDEALSDPTDLDRELAHRLADDHGLELWFDPHTTVRRRF
ncbi:MAG TPA: glycosyltransferase family A protein [Solirubrobacteraceae bacterium]|nr:glycosyltransferase family A protein [Solirubrobacteraceae bacterium]